VAGAENQGFLGADHRCGPGQCGNFHGNSFQGALPGRTGIRYQDYRRYLRTGSPYGIGGYTALWLPGRQVPQALSTRQRCRPPECQRGHLTNGRQHRTNLSLPACVAAVTSLDAASCSFNALSLAADILDTSPPSKPSLDN